MNVQVWDSVTCVWEAVDVNIAVPDLQSEEVQRVFADALNDAVSWSTGEARGSWYVVDAHRFVALDMLLVGLRNLRGDSSVIITS